MAFANSNAGRGLFALSPRGAGLAKIGQRFSPGGSIGDLVEARAPETLQGHRLAARQVRPRRSRLARRAPRGLDRGAATFLRRTRAEGRGARRRPRAAWSAPR